MALDNQSYCIGDIVRYCEDLYYVWGIEYGSPNITLMPLLPNDSGRKPLLEVYIGYVFPVVIDEDILEAFGIMKHYKSDSYCYRYYAHNESVRLAYIKKHSKWEVRFHSAICFTKLSVGDYVRVKYLHQLQWMLRIWGLKDLVYIK